MFSVFTNAHTKLLLYSNTIDNCRVSRRIPGVQLLIDDCKNDTGHVFDETEMLAETYTRLYAIIFA